jgi:hypothetical protein
VPQDAKSVVDGGTSPYAIVRHRRTTTIGLAIACVIIAVVFGSIGTTMLAREYLRLARWQAVQATVLETRVDAHSNSDGNTYLPVVVYRYTVNDRAYTSSRALPVNESRSGSWANQVIAPFTVGGTYTAWYDPGSPSDAFIVRTHSIIAPVFTLIGALAIVGAVIIVERPSSRV